MVWVVFAALLCLSQRIDSVVGLVPPIGLPVLAWKVVLGLSWGEFVVLMSLWLGFDSAGGLMRSVGLAVLMWRVALEWWVLLTALLLLSSCPGSVHGSMRGLLPPFLHL